MENKQQIKRLVSVMVGVSFPVAMYGLLQRYHIDPIPWGGDVSERIASSMGNSIFVAAYLIMVFPLTLMRVISSFQELAKEQDFAFLPFIKATIYLFILILQLIALFFSGSRGPALGWMSSILFFFLFWFWWQRKKNAALSVISGTLLIALFLLVFNLPNSPFESLKENPAIGRFGQLLDPQSNNALVRTYIWQGAAKLFSNLKPLEYPDGRKDNFYFLRPLIGYGPESMYVAYNRFYPPQLTLVEKRNASPDRSHNETWDSLLMTGVIGFIIYLMLFSSLFYYGYKRLGLIENKFEFKLFFILLLGLGTIFSILMVLWRGVEYFGIAFPIGMISGLFLFLVYKIFRQSNAAVLNDFLEEDAILLIAILSVFVAHLIEINFGIAIVVTRTYFWFLAGLV
ncbi:MAG: O-antigen ligase family protein, partial [Anaerolineales bacterium]